MNKSCKNCEFSIKEVFGFNETTYYRCRRFPPYPNIATHKNNNLMHDTQRGDTYSYDSFPSVQEDDWCGEFKEKPCAPTQN